MFLSTFSAIFLSRSELKNSSFRCGSDSTVPLTPWQFTWALSHSQISLKFSPVDTNDSVSKPLSCPGYQCYLWTERSHAITIWAHIERSVLLSSDTNTAFYKFIMWMVATSLHSCFIFPICKTSSFWFWFSDSLGHGLKTPSLPSYCPQGLWIWNSR